MIYEQPRFLVAGERYYLIELGNEANLLLNIEAIAICRAIRESKLEGVIETIPGLVSVLVHYEPALVKRERLRLQLEELIAGMADIEEIETDSRLVEIPVMYDDPWTNACVQDYSKRITPVPNNPSFVAQYNKLSGVRELIRYHSTPQYWIASLGTWPGLPFCFPMDPSYRITAPKYNPARTWTPEGAIGFGGACTSIYSVRSPGGYQLMGRTPVPIWDPQARLPEFEGSPALLRTGDRVKFLPIDLEEYEAISRLVEEGTYRINIITYERIAVRAYVDFLRKHPVPPERMEVPA
jgi:urea carboxylase